MVAQEVTLHDVWANNLEEEFAKLRDLLDTYPYVAMDTEFPGVVATPMGQFKSKEDFNYQQLYCNVNMLKLIQVGFALVNAEGHLPPSGDMFQFNFHFSLSDDMYSIESVDLLKSSGFDFNRHQNEGIRMEDFGELLTTSGLIVDSKIIWITFHRYYKAFFPKSYDIKMLMKQPGPAAKLKGGLQEVADVLSITRFGRRHQAGSDALLTARTFFKIKELFFADNWNEVSDQVQGQMYGLGNTLSILPMYLQPSTPINNSTGLSTSLSDATSTSAIYASLQNDNDLGSSVSSES